MAAVSRSSVGGAAAAAGVAHRRLALREAGVQRRSPASPDRRGPATCMYIVAGSERSRWLCSAVISIPPSSELLHHRVDLVLGQHEVAHDHRLVARRLEGEPGAEREARLDLDAVERDLQVGARQADAVDAAGAPAPSLPRAWPTAFQSGSAEAGAAMAKTVMQ